MPSSVQVLKGHSWAKTLIQLCSGHSCQIIIEINSSSKSSVYALRTLSMYILLTKKWSEALAVEIRVCEGIWTEKTAASPCGLTHMLVNLQHVLGSWSTAPSSSAVWLRHPVPFPLLCTRVLVCSQVQGKTQNHSLAPSDPSKRSALGSSGIDWSYTRRPYLGLFTAQVHRPPHVPMPISVSCFYPWICSPFVLWWSSHVIPSNAKVKLIYFGV